MCTLDGGPTYESVSGAVIVNPTLCFTVIEILFCQHSGGLLGAASSRKSMYIQAFTAEKAAMAAPAWAHSR